MGKTVSIEKTYLKAESAAEEYSSSVLAKDLVTGNLIKITIIIRMSPLLTATLSLHCLVISHHHTLWLQSPSSRPPSDCWARCPAPEKERAGPVGQNLILTTCRDWKAKQSVTCVIASPSTICLSQSWKLVSSSTSTFLWMCQYYQSVGGNWQYHQSSNI